MQIKTLLFVDDDVEMLRAWKRQHRQSRNVLTATTGSQAVELAQQNEVDLVIVDQRLTGEPGIDVIEKLRELRELRDATFVLTSAELNGDDHVSAFERGVPVFPKLGDWPRYFAAHEARTVQAQRTHASLDSMTAEIISRTLRQHGNNIARTARVLGFSRNGLKGKLVKLDIKLRRSS